jgi:low affinity Fe/Cu permease
LTEGFTPVPNTGCAPQFDGMSKTLSNSSDSARTENCSIFHGAFRACSQWIAQAVGSSWAFATALSTVVVWGLTGPLFHYSDTWQLVINTATTIITFLMVFLIQNTQNRDTKAIHLKLDELLRGVKGARTSLINLEAFSDEELDQLQHEFERVRGRAGKEHQGPKAAAA